MLDKLYDAIPVGRNEAASAYNGPFSTTTEWHAFTVGSGAGLATGATGNVEFAAFAAGFALKSPAKAKGESKVGHLIDLAREPAYALGGLVLGFVVGATVRVV